MGIFVSALFGIDGLIRSHKEDLKRAVENVDLDEIMGRRARIFAVRRQSQKLREVPDEGLEKNDVPNNPEKKMWVGRYYLQDEIKTFYFENKTRAEVEQLILELQAKDPEFRDGSEVGLYKGMGAWSLEELEFHEG